MSSKWFRWCVLAAFLLQTGLLAWLVIDRALLLKNGKEIRLAVVPVDPRDLLRGDYVVLAYPISRIESDQVTSDSDLNPGDAVYVTLTEGADGWQAQSIHRTQPDGGVFLRGTVDDAYTRDSCKVASPCTEYTVDYSLDRFFVPEGQGRDLEKLRNDQRMSVDVAVAKDGRAALKKLLVDGQVRYHEDLY